MAKQNRDEKPQAGLEGTVQGEGVPDLTVTSSTSEIGKRTRTKASPLPPIGGPSGAVAGHQRGQSTKKGMRSDAAADPSGATSSPPLAPLGRVRADGKIWISNVFELPAGVDRSELELGEPMSYGNFTVETLKAIGAYGVYRMPR